MIVNGASGFGSFAGTWEDFCGTAFANDPTNLAKCNSKASCLFGSVCLPGTEPWTQAGANARGIPLVAQGAVYTGPPGAGSAGAGAAIAKTDGTTTALTIAAIGAGFLGVILFVVGQEKRRRPAASTSPAVAGYRRNRRRRLRRSYR